MAVKKNEASEIENQNEFDSFIPRGRNLRFDDFSEYDKSDYSQNEITQQEPLKFNKQDFDFENPKLDMY